MYTVNGTKFDSYIKAIEAAKAIGANVVQADNGIVRWTPPAPAKARTKHVILNADGTTTEFGKVRK